MPVSGNFDLLAVLRQIALTFWAEFAPIMIAGFALLTLPAIVGHVFGNAQGEIMGTAGQTLSLVLTMLFLAVVSCGATAALHDHKLSTAAFLSSGLRAAQPGLLVALVMGVVATTGVILVIIAAGHPLAWLVRGSVTGTLIWLLATWLPAIPAAITERLPPFEALRRAAALTRGHRGILLILLLVAVLALIPGAMLINTMIFGPNATPEGAQATLDAMPLLHPGLWIYALFELLGTGLIACVPPVVYWQLTTAK